jgi:copper chaperone CopZ
MNTNLRVDGANCPLCLNELVDRLRSVDGITSVNSSITEGCVAIDHDDVLTRSDLVELIGASLHGTAMASNEIVMTTIDPVVTVLHCAHESAHRPASATVSADHRLETVTDALTRLRSDGYTAEFYATDKGELACRGCDGTMDPTEVQVDHTVRFEGDTNPDDQDIVFAITCACGCKGTYSAAYGPATPPADSDVLRQLAHAAHPAE